MVREELRDQGAVIISWDAFMVVGTVMLSYRTHSPTTDSTRTGSALIKRREDVLDELVEQERH